MCLKNDYAKGIWNGAIYITQDDRSPGDGFRIKDAMGRQITVPSPTVETFDPGFESDKYDDNFTPFAVAYACTVHKAQGSEWRSVLLVDEYRQVEGRRTWLYTGITRAMEQVTVLKRW